MTISQVATQAGGKTQDSSATVSRAFTANVTAGNLVWIAAAKFDTAAFTAGNCTAIAPSTATIDTPTLDKQINVGNIAAGIWSAKVLTPGTLTLQIASTAGSYWAAASDELSSDVGWDASRVEDSNSASGTLSVQQTPNMTSAGKAAFVGVMAFDSSSSDAITQDAPYSLIYKEENGTLHEPGAIEEQIVSAGTTAKAGFSTTPANIFVIAGVVYREIAGVSSRLMGQASL